MTDLDKVDRAALDRMFPDWLAPRFPPGAGRGTVRVSRARGWSLTFVQGDELAGVCRK